MKQARDRRATATSPWSSRLEAPPPPPPPDWTGVAPEEELLLEEEEDDELEPEEDEEEEEELLEVEVVLLIQAVTRAMPCGSSSLLASGGICPTPRVLMRVRSMDRLVLPGTTTRI